MNTLDSHNLPNHVAVIMDGNGRWARKRSLNRVQGHEKGAEAVRNLVRTSRELGIRWVTLYAFSEENWKRPQREIQALMALLERFLQSELEEMLEKGIRLQSIGSTEKLPDGIREALTNTAAKTADNTNMVLTLALSYGGRQEIVNAARRIAVQIESGRISSEEVTEGLLSDHLYTAGIPEPDLLIRTSGEYRISNFMLWQMAYTEMYFTPTLWPDFGREEYLSAIREFQNRERRFGSTP